MKGVHVVLRWALAGALLVVLGVGVVPTILKETALATPPASCDLPIYQDALASNWENWSWNGTYNLAETAQALGSFSIGATITQTGGGLSVRHTTGISGNLYTSVVFWIHGGASESGVRQLKVVVQTADDYADEPGYPINVLPNQWTQVIVPLSAIGNPATIKRINIQDNSGAPQPTFYVDELCLSSTAAPPPPPPGCTLPVYLEALAPNWENWSWNGTYNLAETAQALGSFSIGATITQTGGGLSVRHTTGISGNLYTSVVFWIHGGASGSGVRQLKVVVQTADDYANEPIGYPINVLPNQWTQVIVPLSAIGNPSHHQAHQHQDNSGAPQPTFYVDELCLSSTAAPPPPPPGCDVPVYLEALAPNWQSWSWDGTYNLAETAQALGSFSIGATITKAHGALSITSTVPGGVSTGSYTSLVFWIHGGNSGTRQLQVIAQVGNDYNGEPAVHVDAPSNQWTHVVIPLSALGNPATIKRIYIQDRTGSPQPTFYVDNLCLSSSLIPTPTPTNTPTPTSTLTPPGPTPTPGGPTPTPAPACSLPIYQDALASNWQNWSWDGTYNFADTGQVYAGGVSIGATITQAYGGLSVRHTTGISGNLYTSVVFWIHGGASGSGVRQLQVVVQTDDNYANEPGYPINILPNQWTQVIVPLSAIGNPATIKRINIQDNSGAPQPTFYVDELCLSSVATPPPPPLGCSVPVYLEALAPNWQNWSWNGTYNLAETAQALGSFSIGATITKAHGALSITSTVPGGVSTGSYTSLVFWIHGGNSGTRQLK
jgi:hypothetical protein